MVSRLSPRSCRAATAGGHCGRLPLSIDRFAQDAAPPWEDEVGAPSRAEQDLRLLHTLAALSESAPDQLLRAVGERLGTTASYDRLRARTRLPNAVRAELKDTLDEWIRRETAIREACVTASHDLTRVVLGMSGLVLLAVRLLLQ